LKVDTRGKFVATKASPQAEVKMTDFGGWAELRDSATGGCRENENFFGKA
jgi:hypothetical protein